MNSAERLAAQAGSADAGMSVDELYPELASSGSLAAALSLAAAEIGVDIDGVAPAESDPRHWARVPSKDPDRTVMGIGIGAVERWFLINGWSRGVELVSGATQDLYDVVRAASAWREGATLHEIQHAAPFVGISEMAFAHERGPADAVDLAWARLHRRAAAQSPEQLLPLVEAAAAEPKLRQLLPYTSHWTLLFTTCTGYPYSQEISAIAPLANNRYRVIARGGVDRSRDVDTAAEAVALVMGWLPANVGPAVAGSIDE